MDAGALPRGERPFVEVTLHGRAHEVLPAEAAPANEVLRGDEDGAFAGLAAGAAAGAVQVFTGLRIDEGVRPPDEIGVEGRGGHG